VATGNFSQEKAFVFHETIESNFAIFRDNNEVVIVVTKLERLHDIVDHDLMLNQERFGIVYNHVVSVFAHDREHLLRVILPK
jgi:hypothetical protein